MQAIKRTVIGGLVFLLPIMVVILILEQAIDFAMLVAEPLSDIILLDMPGVILANLLAAGLVVCVCYIAGLIATSASVRALSERGDSFFNENLPGYMFVKMFIGSIMGPEEMEKDFEPIVYEVQNVKRIGFEVERSEDGWVTVFLPHTPVPWSGITMIVAAENVTRLDVKNFDALGPLSRLGKGSMALARRV